MSKLLHYDFGGVIGRGGFSTVRISRHLITDTQVASKIMNKLKLRETDDLHRAYFEIETLKSISHPRICQLYEIIETDTSLYLFMELAPQGEVFDYIVASGRVKEPMAKVFFKQMVEAVEFLHQKNIVHRDLKPENFLLTKDRKVILSDFGLCAQPKSITEKCLSTSCGSIAYSPPEVFFQEGYAGMPVDIWSLGVILYALLVGALPFDHENQQKLAEKIIEGIFTIPFWVSIEAEACVCAMLKHRPGKRPSAADVLNNPWLHGVEAVQEDGHVDFTDSQFEPDQQIVQEMAQQFNTTESAIRQNILERSYDQVTSTYLILRAKKQQGQRPVCNRLAAVKKEDSTDQKTKSCSGQAKLFEPKPPETPIPKKTKVEVKRALKVLAKSASATLELGEAPRRKKKRGRASTVNADEKPTELLLSSPINHGHHAPSLPHLEPMVAPPKPPPCWDG